MHAIELALLWASVGVLLTLYGDAGPLVHITIPFDFVVGHKLLAAGSYALEKLDERAWVFLIKSMEGGFVVYTLTNPISGGDVPPEGSKLIFHRCRDLYFLAQIWVLSSAREVPKSRLERDLVGVGAPIEQVYLGTNHPRGILSARLRNSLFKLRHGSEPMAAGLLLAGAESNTTGGLATGSGIAHLRDYSHFVEQSSTSSADR